MILWERSYCYIDSSSIDTQHYMHIIPVRKTKQKNYIKYYKSKKDMLIL